MGNAISGLLRVAPLGWILMTSACALDADEPERDSRRVASAVEAQLNTSPHPVDACVNTADTGDSEEATQRQRQRGRRQVEALIKAYRRKPRALVEVDYFSDGDPMSRLVTVDQLIRRELRVARFPIDDFSDRRCQIALRERLAATVAGSATPRPSIR